MPSFVILDVRTTALLVVMAFFIQATAMAAQAYLVREYHGVGSAMLANLCLAVGFLLNMLMLPYSFAQFVSSLLILTSPALSYVALSRFLELPYRSSLAVGVISFALAFVAYSLYVQNTGILRAIAMSLGVASLIVLVLYKLWQSRNSPLRFSLVVLFLSFLLYGLFLIFRSVELFQNPPSGLLVNSPIQVETHLLLFVMSFFWTIGFMLMVSQRLQYDLTKLAMIDVLTRIPNRRAAQVSLEREIARSHRENRDFSVLLVDIDKFKRVNDEWGHATGDKVLVKVANILNSLLRSADFISRWGGEEFLIILPGTPYQAVETLAERLRSEVANYSFSQGTSNFHITISIGAASATHEDTIDRILRRADVALYEAKKTRNTTVVWEN